MNRVIDLLNFNSMADTDPPFHSNADPDLNPAYKNNADHANPDPQLCSKPIFDILCLII
jgi:hypothetical protein